MATSDQELLAEHVRGHAGAFRELLERHGGLVYGVAWRVTSDRMLAEEVVQEVFCLLARRAAVMSAHPSVVGWLHRTGLNVARGVVRRRRRHDQKLVRFASEASVDVGMARVEGPWEAMDQAIDRLPADERAVVLLRYFREMEYVDIGAHLGISEMAARKRVSRALERLQRALGGSCVARLVPGGLARPLPGDVSGSVWGSLPGSAPGGSLPLIFMTHKHLMMAAGALLLGGGLTWFAVSERIENQRLAAEMDRLRLMVAARPGSGGADAGQPAGASATAAAGALAVVREELAAERQKRLAAEREARTLRETTAGLSDEVVVSFGKVSEIGSTLGSVFTEAMALSELEKSGGLDTPEGQGRFAKFIEKASSISGLSREIVGFEDKPEEGSQFVAATYAAAFGLNEADTAKVADFFAARLAAAGDQKLTLSNLPERGSPEFGPWLEKRWAFFNDSRDALRQVLPEATRGSFDQWVEKGGYGFKNLTVKGAPLMFSLGGDPR